MAHDHTSTESFAAWPWQPPPGRAPFDALRPSPDPTTAALEHDVGLTAQVVRRWASLVPDILGPLCHADSPVPPLSLAASEDPCSFRADVVVTLVERIVVLAVLTRTDLTA